MLFEGPKVAVEFWNGATNIIFTHDFANGLTQILYL